MSNKLILIVPNGADSLLEILDKHMRAWRVDNKDDDDDDDARSQLPFEIHAYEAILATAKQLQTQELDGVSRSVNEVLGHFKEGSILSIDIQERMRTLKNAVSKMISKVTAYCKEINDLIEDDEGLALMNLTILKKNPKLYQSPLQPGI